MKAKIPVLSALFLIICLLNSGCNLPNIAGGMRAWDNAYADLTEQGVPWGQSSKILDKEKMSREEFDEYSKNPSIYVRMFIAGNPHVPVDIMNKLAEDDNKFVRRSVASNHSITKDLVKKLAKERGYFVPRALVSNPSVPEDVILKIHKRGKISLAPYAMNPNCPQSIRQEIIDSNDYNATGWLKVTDDWKENGTWVKGKGGRWYWYDPEKSHAKRTPSPESKAAAKTDEYEELVNKLASGRKIIGNKLIMQAKGVQGEELKNIQVYVYKDNKHIQTIMADKAQIKKLGNGMAELVFDRPMITSYDKGFTQKKKTDSYKLSFDYRMMPKVN